jgi:hypothetical protein
MTPMRFDPDPLCLNKPPEKPRRVQRAITELSLDTQPQSPVINPKFRPKAPEQPLVTALDVHGCPDRGPPAAESIELPPSLLWLVNAGAKVIAAVVCIFWVAVLASRRQRRAVIAAARERKR